MKRPRKFLTLILILLVINTVFFVSWYAFDVQGVVKRIVEREAGKALEGEFEISDFSISDQQVFAEGITFAAADSVFGFKINSARARFNLLKFIFSGFKINNLLDHVEIAQGDVFVSVFPQPGPQKPREKLEIPDLTEIFNNLKVTDSRLKIDVITPLPISGPGMLRVSEELEQVNISIINSNVSHIKIDAITAKKGVISASGILDDGRLSTSHLEISNYIPLYVSHPQVRDLTSEINLVADGSQKEKYANLDLSGKAILWNTQALLFSQYPLQIPLLTVESDGDKLLADLSQSRLGTSSLEGMVSLTGLQNKIVFKPSQLDLQLDLSMIDPGLQGVIAAKLNARGSLDDPVATLSARSQKISYLDQSVSNIDLVAALKDKELSFVMDEAVWENQSVSINGTFFTKDLKLSANLETTPISLAREELKISAIAEIDLAFYEKLPEVKARILDLAVATGDLDLRSISGYANLFPTRQGDIQNYYVDLELDSPDGTSISLIGDIMDRNLLLDANINAFALMDVYPLESLRQYDPIISGKISSFLTGSKLVLSTQLDLAMTGGLDFRSGLDLIASYDLAKKDGMAILESTDGTLNGEPVALELIAELHQQDLILHTFRLNDQLYLSGSVDLQNIEELAFELTLKDMDSAAVAAYLPDLVLPEVTGVSLYANYNRDGSEILNADLKLEEFKIPGLRPLSGFLNLRGYLEQVEISGGISTQFRRLIDLSGTVNVMEGPDLRLQAITTKLSAADLMYSALAEGSIDADLGLYMENVLSPQREISFDARVASRHISVPDVVDLDDLLIRMSQSRELLVVDTLSVSSPQFGSAKASGALDYNLTSNTFYEGTNILNLEIEGHFFDWLARNVDMIDAASGNADIICAITTYEGQFQVQSGELDIRNTSIQLKDQPEPIRDLNIQAVIEDNELQIDNFTCFIGDGKLTVKNAFEDDPSSHLTVGFLDLGTLALRLEQPGALVNIPIVTAPRSRSNIVLQGRNTTFATIKGPFEDMAISAEIIVSNTDLMFPPNTNNLLNLIYSFRSALTKPAPVQSDPPPLPFTMDLMIRIMDNVKYTTYPANFRMQRGGFLHIIYDGRQWKANDASFISEEGSIDFFGTVFQVDNLNVMIIDSQNLIDIQGSFYRRSPAGSIVTLSVTTDPDTSKPIFERLIFTLKSDNPDDTTITEILNRARYSSVDEEIDQELQGIELQDQALDLISQNLNTTLVTPFIYPLETTIRRFLKLDNFSINAGFIQNLFTEYSSDPNQLAEYVDMDQFMGDITQFSSSILLNNLSISMSKYLGGRIFLDYTLTLQEATDLQKQSRIVTTHDTSLRMFLPWQLRLAYTFKYEPLKDKNLMKARTSHEIMLQRSFRFWGL